MLELIAAREGVDIGEIVGRVLGDTELLRRWVRENVGVELDELIGGRA